MERTAIVDDTIHLGEKEMLSILHKMVRYYQFQHGNQLPSKVVVPIPDVVDGIPVELEEVQ